MLAASHNDMDAGSVKMEVADLKVDLLFAKREFDKLKVLMDVASASVRAVEDVGEYHTGGSVTQF